MNKSVIIIGIGGHGKVIADVVLEAGDKIVGFLDAKYPEETEFLGFRILGKDTDYYRFIDNYFIIAIGNPQIRSALAMRMEGVKWYTAIHPSAIISNISTEIGEGTAIMAGSIINPGNKIGKHCIINSGAIVEHDNIVADFAHISVGAVLAGDVKVGEKTWVGVGASIKNGISICDNVMIGAGATVVKNIEQCGTYIGVPAKKIDK